MKIPTPSTNPSMGGNNKQQTATANPNLDQSFIILSPTFQKNQKSVELVQALRRNLDLRFLSYRVQPARPL